MGFIARGEEDISTRIVTYFQSNFLSMVNLDSFRMDDIKGDLQMKMDMIADFRKMGVSMREVSAAFQVPNEWVLLHRTLLLLLGVVTHLDPAFNPMTVIRPFLEDLMTDKRHNWVEFAGNTLKQALIGAVTSLTEMRGAIQKLNQGKIVVRLDESRSRASAGHQLPVCAGLTAVAGLVSYHAWLTDHAEALNVSLPVTGLFLVLTLRLLSSFGR